MALNILGVGPICSLGSGIGSFRNGLMGRTSPCIVEQLVALPRRQGRLRVYQPVLENIESHIPARSLRRLDHFTQMALFSASLALQDSGLVIEERSRMGVIFGSAYGPARTTFQFLDGFIDEGDRFASPTHFANSVHSTPASQISILLKIDGVCTTLTCFKETLAGVLMTAEEWLDSQRVDHLLVCLGDEYCAVLGHVAATMGAGGADRIVPFAFDQCTYLPGEGCVSLLLTRDSTTASRYGQLEPPLLAVEAGQISKEYFKAFDAVFIAAHGMREEGETYAQIPLEYQKTVAYSPLYGGFPVGAAFELAAGALSLCDSKIYAHPWCLPDAGGFAQLDRGGGLDKPPARIACIEYANPGHVNIYSLHKP